MSELVQSAVLRFRSRSIPLIECMLETPVKLSLSSTTVPEAKVKDGAKICA